MPDEILGLVADRVPYIARLERKRPPQNVVPHLDERLRPAAAAEGRIAAEEKVGDDADGPDVASFVVISPNDLRRDCVGRPYGIALRLSDFKMLRKAKVDHLELRIVVGAAKEEVLQFEVAVDNALRMDVAEGAEHLPDEAGALLLRVVVVRLLVEPVEELPPETELLHQIYLLVALVHLLEPDDVRVIQLAHDEDLLAELLQTRLVVNVAEFDRLHRVLHAGAGMFDFSDHAGDTGAEDLAGVDALIHLLYGLPVGHLHVHDVGGESPGGAVVYHFVEADDGAGGRHFVPGPGYGVSGAV
mmetsp:Transcript_1149/g.2513  ORF Transcript_1149/g.2513 Transcript_1149/m.2513 type:complete len:301 (+) Transcript_1149:2102-3004(+)